MKKIIYSVITLAALTGCYKSKFSNTANPDESTVELTVNWDLHEGETTPSAYTLYIGEQMQSLESTTHTFVVEPSEGQTIFIHNNPSGMAVIDKVATLSEATRSTPVDPEPLSGSLYYGNTTVNLPQDNVTNVTVDALRGSAHILFRLSYSASEVVNVQSIKVELSGVAATRNLTSGELSNEVTLTQFPKLQATSSTISVLYNVLGTLGAKQELTITITDINGVIRVAKSDITESLKRFNEKMVPLTFNNSLELPVDVELGDITISDWVVGEGINGEILNPTL